MNAILLVLSLLGRNSLPGPPTADETASLQATYDKAVADNNGRRAEYLKLVTDALRRAKISLTNMGRSHAAPSEIKKASNRVSELQSQAKQLKAGGDVPMDLMPALIRAGKAGVIPGAIHVVQILDVNNFLACPPTGISGTSSGFGSTGAGFGSPGRVEWSGPDFVISGLDTSQFHDDQTIYSQHWPLVATGTYSYTTAMGTQRTVVLLRVVPNR